MNNLILQPSNGFELLKNTIFNCKNITNEVKNAALNSLILITSNLNQSKVENHKLIGDINYIYSVFARYTAISATELNPEEKLYVMYAFRDIMDDIDLKMNEIINQRNTASHHHPLPMLQISLAIAHYIFNSVYNTGIFGKIERDNPSVAEISEEEIIKNLSLLEAHIEKSKTQEILEKELQKTPEENTLLSQMKLFFTEKKEDRVGTLSSDKFQLIQKQMNQRHLHKKKPLKQVASYFDVQRDIVNPAYKYLIDSEEQILIDMTKKYLPENLFEQKSLQDLIRPLVLDLMSHKAKVIQEIGLDLFEGYRKRFTENLELVFSGNNLTRLAMHMSLQIETALYALKTMDQDDGCIQSMIKHLIFNPSSETDIPASHEFNGILLDSITQNLAKICTEGKKEAEIGDTSTRLLAALKNKVADLENFTGEEVLKIILKKVLTVQNLRDYNPFSNLTKNDVILNLLGLQGQIEKINTLSDTLFLFVINSLCEEVEEIAYEAREAQSQGLSTDVSGFSSNEEAREELKNFLFGIIKAIDHLGVGKDIKNRNDSRSFMNDLKESLLMYFFELQGEGGLTDLSTPACKNLLKKWQEWLK